MEFSTKAQRYVEDEDKNQRIYSFKLATRNIAEATKNLKLIQANMKVYSVSSNPYLAGQYNAMRKDLGELLRSIEELKLMKDESAYVILKQIRATKDMPKEFDRNIMKDVENLIAEEKISATNATSILNDSSFIADIAMSLMEAVEVIFTKEEWLETAEESETERKLGNLAYSLVFENKILRVIPADKINAMTYKLTRGGISNPTPNI